MQTLTRPRASYFSKYVPTAGDGCVFFAPALNDAYGATLKDISGNRNNGTIFGATWVRNSKGLWVLDFDGTNDKVVMASAPVTAYPFTLVGWQQSALGAGERSLISLANSASTIVWWFVSIDVANKPVLGAKNTSSKWITGSVVDASWHFIVGVFASATSRELFCDGVSVGTSVNSVPYSSANSVCWIGAIGSSSPSYKDSNIALPRVFNVALSIERIKGYYNQERHLFGV